MCGHFKTFKADELSLNRMVINVSMCVYI